MCISSLDTVYCEKAKNIEKKGLGVLVHILWPRPQFVFIQFLNKTKKKLVIKIFLLRLAGLTLKRLFAQLAKYDLFTFSSLTTNQTFNCYS